MSIYGDSQQIASAVNTPSRGDSSNSPQGLQQPMLQDAARPFPANNTTVPTSFALCCVDARAPVLLQTARTTLYKFCSPDKCKEVWIIFDTGNQRSYITEAVKNHLSLTSISTKTKGFRAENQSQ